MIATAHNAKFGNQKKPFYGMSAVSYASSGGFDCGSGCGSSSAAMTGTGRRSALSRKFTVVKYGNVKS